MREINSFERLVVVEQLRKQNIQEYTMRQGNGCVWVKAPHGGHTLNYYFIFKEGELVDIQVE
jgi:hypothetical protein